jgi:hypothetical protein
MSPPAPSRTFTAAQARFVGFSLVALACGALLTYLGFESHDRGLAYFIGIPFGLIGLLGTGFFLLRKPIQLVIAPDALHYGVHRIPWADVTVGPVELRRRGNMFVRAFNLSAIQETPKMKIQTFELNALMWKQFDLIHQLLTRAAQPGPEGQRAREEAARG